jgi:DUF1365 family protein
VPADRPGAGGAPHPLVHQAAVTAQRRRVRSAACRAYVLHVRDPAESLLRFAMPKIFHISTCMGMDQDSGWRFTAPAERLAVHMENRE